MSFCHFLEKDKYRKGYSLQYLLCSRVVPRFPIPKGIPKISRKSGTGLGTGMDFVDHCGKFRDRLLSREILGKITQFSQKMRLGREDIFAEYFGPIGDGDRLEIGEFSGKIPQNSPKIGVGMGKTFSGNIGDQLGMGID